LHRLNLPGGRVSSRDRFFKEGWLRWEWLGVISLDEFWWPRLFAVASLREPFLEHRQWSGRTGHQGEAEQRQHELLLTICSGCVGPTQRCAQDIEVLTQREWIDLLDTLAQFALQAQGKIRRALTMLGAALAQAEPEVYVRLFADEGVPTAHLLAQVSLFTTASPGYLQHLQAALAAPQPALLEDAPSKRSQPLPHPLSEREHEVLSLLAEGASNQQIADRLVISLEMARRHVRHLLAKLSATNRTQAVARARDLQLL
jgi:DNA-binding CsgD family transcriptional regulator